MYKCKKNEVYKNGNRRRSCTSKTAKIHHFITLVMYCFFTTDYTVFQKSDAKIQVTITISYQN